MRRTSVPKLDAILGKPWPVLRHGFIRLVDYMGDDKAIVQAARISYGAGTKTVRKDAALIRYLLRHDHTTPFEMCEIKIHVRAPIDVWRQWIRHRTANVNEYSTRYSEAIGEMETTQSRSWRRQSTASRQGSADLLSLAAGKRLSREEVALQKRLKDVYRNRLRAGVAREQARKDLPLSTYTEAYWKIDLHNLLRFLTLRMAGTAQLEIRAYANLIYQELLTRWCPIVAEAFSDYQLNSLKLSKNEIELIHLAQSGEHVSVRQLVKKLGWRSDNRQSSELKELRRKANLLGIDLALASPTGVTK